MATRRRPLTAADKERVAAALHRDVAAREGSYRAQALKLFPHVCARCGRELGGKRLRELTVHHRNHDHSYNPTDGSNWELLCLYCHDHEHEKHKLEGCYEAGRLKTEERAPVGTFNPFESLDTILKKPSDAAPPSDPSAERPA